MKYLTATISLLILFSTLLFAQEANKRKEEEKNKKGISVNQPDEIEAIVYKIEFKNNSGTILTITDEGNNAGSITLPSLPSINSSDSKLYNLGGNLFWGTSILGKGASSINGLSDGATGNNCVFLGAGAFNTGSKNTAIGRLAFVYNTTGFKNVAIGYETLLDNTFGWNNTASGYQALNSNEEGSFNTASGSEALISNKEGNFNTACGNQALYHNISGGANTAIGYFSGPTTSNLYNTTCIGASAHVSVSNHVRIGNNSVTQIGGKVAWSNLSDGRYKTNVQEDVKGLEFVLGLRPITYNLTIGVKEELTKRQTGFIAQEVEALANRIGYEFSGIEVPENDESMYSLRYAEFVVPIVKAMQEQQKLIMDLKKEIDQLKSR